MTNKRAEALLAAALTAVAGYVDAIGYLSLGGTFVSFMSGNTTELGVDLGTGNAAKAETTAIVLGLFVLGVIVGHLVRRRARGLEQAAVLALVTVLLVGAGALHEAGGTVVAMAAAVLAMGAENATFEKDGEVKLGVTFVSSTLVKVGDRIAEALCGGAKLGWVTPALRWLALAGGAVLGGLAFHAMGLEALWAAAMGSAVCTIAAYAANRHS